ncbi:MAG TPA: chalcone isomerase family protein [bacterium]|nr:chalcone isomerase family protein [bacterium]
MRSEPKRRIEAKSGISRKSTLLLLACLAAFAAQANTIFAEKQPPAATPDASGKICLDDVCFDREVVSGGRRIPVRGIGHATFFTFHLYTAALYADARHDTVAEILDASPKRLVIEYRHGFKKDDIVKYSVMQLKANPGVNFDAIRGRFEELCAQLQDVKKGDRYEIVYKPEKGTELLFNGTSKIVIPGRDFAKAYFGIWLSEYPISAGLRRHLLRDIRRETQAD